MSLDGIMKLLGLLGPLLTGNPWTAAAMIGLVAISGWFLLRSYRKKLNRDAYDRSKRDQIREEEQAIKDNQKKDEQAKQDENAVDDWRRKQRGE